MRRLASVFLIPGVLAACSDLEPGTVVSDSPDFRPEPDPVRVVVTPVGDTLTELGAVASFAAVAIGPDDQVLQTATITWRSTDESVATVNPSTGSATAVGYGTTDIRAESGDVQGVAKLMVQEPSG